jgi:hypothetical protein
VGGAGADYASAAGSRRVSVRGSRRMSLRSAAAAAAAAAAGGGGTRFSVRASDRAGGLRASRMSAGAGLRLSRAAFSGAGGPRFSVGRAAAAGPRFSVGRSGSGAGGSRFSVGRLGSGAGNRFSLGRAGVGLSASRASRGRLSMGRGGAGAGDGRLLMLPPKLDTVDGLERSGRLRCAPVDSIHQAVVPQLLILANAAIMACLWGGGCCRPPARMWSLGGEVELGGRSGDVVWKEIVHCVWCCQFRRCAKCKAK